MTIQTDPALPQGNKPGLTAREYAAIHLRFPKSGTDWLDSMILSALHLDYMVAATSRSVEYGIHNDLNVMFQMKNIAAHAHQLADAMMDVHYFGEWDP